MRVAVVGAGAMGAILGAALADAGAEPTLIDVSGPLVDRIRADGIEVRRNGDSRVLPLPATTDPGEIGIADVVIFFVKCYHTAAAADAARPLVGPETTVVSLQNGWGNGDVLAERFGADRLVVGVTYNSGTVVEPGVVAHTGAGPTFVGAWNGAGGERAEKLAELLRAGGFETTATPAVTTEIWKKLVLNAATLPTAALTGLAAGEVEAFGLMQELVDQVATEAVAVARASGYEIELQERLGSIHAVLERAGAGKPSMLQDFEAGRRTEIDVINGAIVRAGDAAGIAVPLNGALVALVKGWERSRGLAG